MERQQQRELQNLSLDRRLELFFKDWRKVFIDYQKLKRFFTVYKSDEVQQPIREAKKQGLHANVWQTAGLGRDEVKNSQVLKWFLDYRGDHGRGNEFLKELISLLPERFQIYNVERYSTIAECCPLGQQENRIDIEIDTSQFLLFIEIKIDATEGQDQLQRYINLVQAKAGLTRDWAVIYLTKNGKLPVRYQDQGNQKRLIGISWLQISRLFYKYAKKSDVNNRSAWLAKQFADHIKTF
ncbi:hypothetical protein BJI46_00645 [Acinetobacter qingfengensis]|uniref:Nuclease n=1 Tax=Acinetobacter qingfengensis TaxID=1262585 RepID=A0A1E7RG61_9GAMM|nr:hypothetical protein BJI46_00645 [Acinetobacter qingfengensis]